MVQLPSEVTVVLTKRWLYTVVWEKFMVRNICEKKIRGKKFSSMQAIDENFLTPNISYMHILTCTLNYHLLFFLS